MKTRLTFNIHDKADAVRSKLEQLYDIEDNIKANKINKIRIQLLDDNSNNVYSFLTVDKLGREVLNFVQNSLKSRIADLEKEYYTLTTASPLEGGPV